MFLKGNEDLLSCQGFEVNLKIENSANVIELSVCKTLFVLRGVAEEPRYIGVAV